LNFFILGFRNVEELEKARHYTENKYIYEIWNNPTKALQLDQINVEIPCPVTQYLTQLYGKNWMNHAN
jgi:hypothetical protein